MRDGVWRASIFALVVTGWVAAVQTQSAPPRPGRSSIPTASPATTRGSGPPDLRSTLSTSPSLSANAEVWERVIAKLRAGSMPPPGRPRPDAATYRRRGQLAGDRHRPGVGGQSESGPDQRRPSSESHGIQQRDPRPVRARSDFDVKSLLPGDETADGSFDNFADVLTISTAHLERYLSVARQVTRLATGLPPASSGARDVRDSAARRAGRPAERRPAVRIARRHRGSPRLSGRRRVPDQGPPAAAVSGLHHGHGLAAAARRPPRRQAAEAVHRRRRRPGQARRGQLRRRRRAGLCRRIPSGKSTCSSTGDAGWRFASPVEAGPHVVGVSFVRELWEPEGLPQPLQRGRVLTNDQVYMDYASVGSVQIGGPYGASRTRRRTRRAVARSSSASRSGAAEQRLRHEDPVADGAAGLSPAGDERGRADAARVLRARPARGRKLRRRHPVRARADARRPGLPAARPAGSGATVRQAGRAALSAERPRAGLAPVVLPVEQHSRRALARPGRARAADEAGGPRAAGAADAGRSARDRGARRRLRRPVAEPAPRRRSGGPSRRLSRFRRQPARGVQDRRRSCSSPARCARIAASWICCAPTTRSSTSGWRGTTAFPGSTAAASGASRFRTSISAAGCSGNGALLATTSYPDRTSPVLRGKWLLDNIFGVPVPPPPPGVDTSLPEVKPGAVPPTIRERLAQHRRNPVCASCHSVIDPPGFALENFDAIGGWRTVDESGRPVDATGTHGERRERSRALPACARCCWSSPSSFPRRVTEKLLAYALGRRLEYYDRPAVRRIVRDAAADDYRWSSLILGIVKSPTFLMRASRRSATN